MEIKELLKVLATSFILMIFGITCVSKHYGDDQGVVTSAERLVKEGKETLGILDTAYTERRRNGVAIGYSISYTYTIDSIPYRGAFDFNPKTYAGNTVKVTYLPYDPKIHSTNATGDLEKAKENASSTSGLYIGYGLIALSVLVIIGYIKKVRQRKTEPQPPSDVWL